MADATKRRFPKVLADQLSQALFATRPLGDERMVVLERYRANFRKAIANGGLNADFKGLGDGIPAEWVRPIMELDEAFKALHEYREPGGADDYMAIEVYRIGQSVTAKNDRISGVRHQIEADLRTEYLPAKHGEKGRVKRRLAQKYVVSLRYIDKIIADLKWSVT